MASPPLYIFNLLREDDHYDTIAIDGLGKFITAQITVEESSGLSNITNSKKFHGWFIDRHFPNGHEVKLVDEPPGNWDGRTCHSDQTVLPWHWDADNGSYAFNL
jgi:hypothetical protein